MRERGKAWKSVEQRQIDPETVVLKPWQMELMKHIDNPSDRKILWVQGEKCGEGKTWFQKFTFMVE